MFDTAMRWLGYGLCHQLPARSFFAGGHQLPVCARDTGIYVGFVVSLAVILLLDRRRRRSGMPPIWIIVVGLGLFALMAWDGLTSYLALRSTTNALRLATGLGAGFAFALVIAPMLNGELWKNGSAGRILDTWWSGPVWLLALPLTFAALVWGGPLMGSGYAVFVALCILATFTSVNAVLVALVPTFERRATRLRQLVPVVAIAFAITIVELAGADLLRVALSSLVGRG